jgi:DNA-directed RNA polymerase subunit N (RpoN/RPB10)
MSGAQCTRRPSTRIQLSPKQANIYAWGWQKDARFRCAVCGRRFGKTYLGAEEIRRAYRLAVEHNIHADNEIWYGAPTFKQAKRVMWNRLKRNIPEDWINGRPNNTECVMPMKTGYVIRVVGLDDPDAPSRPRACGSFLGDEWDDAKQVIPTGNHPACSGPTGEWRSKPYLLRRQCAPRLC